MPVKKDRRYGAGLRQLARETRAATEHATWLELVRDRPAVARLLDRHVGGEAVVQMIMEWVARLETAADRARCCAEEEAISRAVADHARRLCRDATDTGERVSHDVLCISARSNRIGRSAVKRAVRQAAVDAGWEASHAWRCQLEARPVPLDPSDARWGGPSPTRYAAYRRTPAVWRVIFLSAADSVLRADRADIAGCPTTDGDSDESWYAGETRHTSDLDSSEGDY